MVLAARIKELFPMMAHVCVSMAAKTSKKMQKRRCRREQRKGIKIPPSFQQRLEVAKKMKSSNFFLGKKLFLLLLLSLYGKETSAEKKR